MNVCPESVLAKRPLLHLSRACLGKRSFRRLSRACLGKRPLLNCKGWVFVGTQSPEGPGVLPLLRNAECPRAARGARRVACEVRLPHTQKTPSCALFSFLFVWKQIIRLPRQARAKSNESEQRVLLCAGAPSPPTLTPIGGHMLH